VGACVAIGGGAEDVWVGSDVAATRVEEGEGGGAGVQIGVSVLRKGVAVLIMPGVTVAGAGVSSGLNIVACGVTTPAAVAVASTAGVAGVPWSQAVSAVIVTKAARPATNNLKFRRRKG